MAYEERQSVERAASWRVDAQLQTQHVISAAAHNTGDARALADDDDWQHCNLQDQGRRQGTVRINFTPAQLCTTCDW
jgi:hypothetical protein